MINNISIALMLCLSFGSLAFGAEGQFIKDPCLDCHARKTPKIVDIWKASRHYGAKVGCVDCHGENAEANHKGITQVRAQDCARCHRKAYEGHAASRHALGLKSGEGCTRNSKEPGVELTCKRCHEAGSARPISQIQCAMFLAQSPEMQRQGCGTCHRIEAGCDTCHSKHSTDLDIAQSSKTCGTCHMGPDHAQIEMWEGSPHGVLFSIKGGKDAPGCVTCHMKDGSHNVSRGIALRASAEGRKAERDHMLSVCTNCHTETLALRNLEDADRIEAQGRLIINEAEGIIRELNAMGLILPAPKQRPGHPLLGNEMILGGHMLYENISRPESLYFRMMMFYYPTSFKGTYHQSPDYAHWYGNAPLKLALSELKSEAAMLKKIDTLERRLENHSTDGAVTPKGKPDTLRTIEQSLRELKDAFLRGAISDKEYNESKRRILLDSGY